MITNSTAAKFNNNLHCRKFINYENFHSNESQVKFCHEEHVVK